MPFSTNRNNLLYEIFYIFLARYRTFFQDFFHATIYYEAEMKFCVPICKSVCVHVTARDLQLRSLVQRYWRGFLRRFRSDFFFIRKRYRYFRMIFKSILRILFQTTLFFHVLHLFAWCLRSTGPKGSIKILKRDF